MDFQFLRVAKVDWEKFREFVVGESERCPGKTNSQLGKDAISRAAYGRDSRREDETFKLVKQLVDQAMCEEENMNKYQVTNPTGHDIPPRHRKESEL